jgi:CrcB protein
MLAVNLVASRYPAATFAVNVVGSLLIGVLAELFALRSGLSHNLRLLLVTGVLGGFTTFSAFSLEVGLFLERGETVAAVLYAVASVVCAVGALFVGMAAIRHFAG